jgi:hypothetical protein
LPTFDIIINCHSRIELCNYIYSVSFFSNDSYPERPLFLVIIDVVGPFYRKIVMYLVSSAKPSLSSSWCDWWCTSSELLWIFLFNIKTTL